ncbi:helix-turn-helix transcriptional regulator [Oscillospiraceae bacterium HV4-5-C5C]|nr:helix-turn-helix transcriptional regulator [Oscillospiraceae bacterium HV4-5-C5C]
MSFHDNLKKRRLDAKLKQAEMAERLGITSQAYGRYENGASKPNTDMLISICDALGVSSNELLGMPTSLVINDQADILKTLLSLVEIGASIAPLELRFNTQKGPKPEDAILLVLDGTLINNAVGDLIEARKLIGSEPEASAMYQAYVKSITDELKGKGLFNATDPNIAERIAEKISEAVF